MTFGETQTIAPAPNAAADQERSAQGAVPKASLTTAVAWSSLSGREREVLLALGRGFTVKEVAAQLGLARGTVAALTARAYRKFGVHDRASALRRYRLGRARSA